jgi:hypothetical protein
MPEDADEHVHCFPTRSGRPLLPEQSLAIAVLEDAVRTLQRYTVADDRAARELVAEVDEWFACNDTDHPFAFVSICDVLALDVGYVRSGLHHWRERRQLALQTEPRVLPLRRLRPSENGVALPTSPQPHAVPRLRAAQAPLTTPRGWQRTLARCHPPTPAPQNGPATMNAAEDRRSERTTLSLPWAPRRS